MKRPSVWVVVAGLLGLGALLVGFVVGAGHADAPEDARDALLPHVDLELALDPTTRVLEVEATLILRGQRRVGFALAEGLTVSELMLNGLPLPPAPSARAGGRQLWRFDAPGGEAVVRLRYRGELARLDAGIDHRGVLRGMPAMAGEEGSYLPAGTGWYPEVPGLFSYRLKLRLPPGQIGVAPGRLVRESPDATRVLPAMPYQAEFDFPHPADGIELMAGPYVIAQRLARVGGRELRLRTYFHAELAALADDYLSDTENYIRRYSNWIGDYPFAGFSVVSSPLPTGFGMPGMTYLGRQVIRLPFIRATSLGHEVLHNWWGNGVYPDGATGNWSEGLTTFMADYHYQERRSDDAGREARRVWLRDFAAVPAADDRPLTAFRGRAHAAAGFVGYGKAAMLFYMLRAKIGAEAFDAGLRLFWQRHRFRQASWADLQVAFEQASGDKLAGFFQQWLTRTGAANVSIVDAMRPAGNTLELTLAQVAPPYQLDLPLLIRTSAGEERRVARLAQGRQRVRLQLSAPPEAVRLDPDFEVWRALAPSELPATLRQVMLAEKPRVTIAGDDPGFRKTALGLAARMLESAPGVGGVVENAAGMLIVKDAEADAHLARLGLPPTPASLRAEGDARAWAVTGARVAPLLVVSARDAAALAALQRGLPHYGQQSYVVFDQGRAIQRGVWPAPENWHGVRAR